MVAGLEGRWRVSPRRRALDGWKDNDYLLHGHRPPMPSFRACFKSIFRIHTETGNIWTHLLGEARGHRASLALVPGAVWPLSTGRRNAIVNDYRELVVSLHCRGSLIGPLSLKKGWYVMS